jgi:hypothetical protein
MDTSFSKWLTEKKGYSTKSASDAASRCRRIERTFALSLDKALSTETGFKKLRERISDEVARLMIRNGATVSEKVTQLMMRNTDRVYAARGAHRLALKLYFEFLGRKPQQDRRGISVV